MATQGCRVSAPTAVAPKITSPESVAYYNEMGVLLSQGAYTPTGAAQTATNSGATGTAVGNVAGGNQFSQISASDLAAMASTNPFKWAMSKFSLWMMMSWFQINPSRAAIMSIKDIGDNTMIGGESLITLGIGMEAAAKSLEKGADGVVGKVAGALSIGVSDAAAGTLIGLLTSTGYLCIMLGMIVFGMGAAIAVYLPMAPFLIYFGAFVGWLILCGEAVIAAPLWAIMHLTPSGDDVMGGARQGYMLILGVLMRPTLIVLGFSFALLVIDVVIQGFNQIFFPVFTSSMTGSVIGFGTVLVGMGIYFATMVSLFHTIFGLIHVIPDKLLRWIGGGGEQLGETARGLSGSGQKGSGQAFAHLERGQQTVMQALQQGRSAKAGFMGKQRDTEARALAEQRTERAARSETTEVRVDAAEATYAANQPGATPSDHLNAVSKNLTAADKVGAEASLQAQKVANLQKSKAPQADIDSAKSTLQELQGQETAFRSTAKEHADKIGEMATNQQTVAQKTTDPVTQKQQMEQVHATAKVAEQAHAMTGNSARVDKFKNLADSTLTPKTSNLNDPTP